MSDSKQVDVLAVMDEAAADLDCQCGHPRCGRQRERARMLDARAAVAELIEAAHRAEVSFNTVGGCYQRNPGNFMAAMRELEQDVIPLRAALANCAPAKGDAP